MLMTLQTWFYYMKRKNEDQLPSGYFQDTSYHLDAFKIHSRDSQDHLRQLKNKVCKCLRLVRLFKTVVFDTIYDGRFAQVPEQVEVISV